ncbi:hypothetical protein L1987_50608 [Smallanthus sonchifolius]|uniref:Uncharacterized protein n=1 Tax=Smallanthus sonchifolius TaxID=185202 RepID=A0ACB9EMZ7_9ASTR|nr:hypothetical protein L1987_50608 [Smallanthus sonchifolius]
MKTPAHRDDLSSSSTPSSAHRNSRNVFQMLTRREISPRIKKNLPRRQGGRTFDLNHRTYVKPRSESASDARRELLSWVEAESLVCLSAKYCSLTPSPRSTIAAAFSPDGKILASTHGDHTVKIIDCHTGKCLKVLSGHRRTPWVVRFNPLRPEILASGSLDHEVRLWNANTSECIGSRDFYRPIASIAFHSEGELLAVAAGHKLYLWQYNSRGETSSPAIILRTRRSLRAVHFHPHSAPLLLTAEVNDLDSADSTMAPATSQGYMGNMHRIDRLSLAAELPLVPLQFMQTDSASNMDISAIEDTGLSQSGRDSGLDPLRDRVRWELPFMQGWLMGQNQAGPPPTFPLSGSPHRYRIATEPPYNIDLGQTNEPSDGVDSIPMMSRIQSQISASLTATAAAELPCTVKLRIWSHDLKNPCALLKAEICRLVIPHAVLCSEMGAHFSPCGRYLAACVACVLPQFEADSGISTQLHQDVSRAGTSPTRHPISARHVVYELRIYSLEEATFGSVLISRPVRAAHCLTSVQFSPSSEHILLAYGRRHSSLLKSIDINGDTSLSIYTVLEVYRVSDMELVLFMGQRKASLESFNLMVLGGQILPDLITFLKHKWSMLNNSAGTCTSSPN